MLNIKSSESRIAEFSDEKIEQEIIRVEHELEINGIYLTVMLTFCIGVIAAIVISKVDEHNTTKGILQYFVIAFTLEGVGILTSIGLASLFFVVSIKSRLSNLRKLKEERCKRKHKTK